MIDCDSFIRSRTIGFQGHPRVGSHFKVNFALIGGLIGPHFKAKSCAGGFPRIGRHFPGPAAWPAAWPTAG